MDFDDLDEELEARLAAGEEVAGFVKENNQPRQGTVLPLMERTTRLPGVTRLPEKARMQLAPYNGQTEVVRAPVVRLLCIHGVADSMQQEWHLFAASAPPEVEVGVHEFPGHGHREKEPVLSSLDELVDDAFEAFREAMDSGAFALLGHSIGCLVATGVARRAREELGVEPVFVFMVERGAPQYPLFTDSGLELLKTDRESFMAIWMPMVLSLYTSAGEMGRRTMDMWQKGWFVENDNRQPGFHTFRCPLTAICADMTVDPYLLDPKLLEEGQPLAAKRPTAANMAFTNAEGQTFVGHFPMETYEKWREWTEHEAFKIVKCKDADHMSIKGNAPFKKEVFRTLSELVKHW